MFVLHRLEPEINKWAEAGGVQGGHTEQETEGGHNPHPDVLTVSEVGVVDHLLQLLSPTCQREEREEDCNGHDGIEMCATVESEATEIEGKQPRDESPSHAEVLDAEKHPDDGDGEEGEDDRRHRPDFFHHLAQEKLVGANKQAMQGTPNDEIPRSAVPSTP